MPLSHISMQYACRHTRINAVCLSHTHDCSVLLTQNCTLSLSHTLLYCTSLTHINALCLSRPVCLSHTHSCSVPLTRNMSLSHTLMQCASRIYECSVHFTHSCLSHTNECSVPRTHSISLTLISMGLPAHPALRQDKNSQK